MKCGSGPNPDRGSREKIKIQMEHIDMDTVLFLKRDKVNGQNK